jgi:hypothetical protein
MNNQALMLECLRLASQVVPHGVADKGLEVINLSDRLYLKILSVDSEGLLHNEKQEAIIIKDVSLADTQKRRGRPPKSK